MPLISHPSRLTLIVVVIASVHIASGTALGQGNEWSPYRDTDLSQEQAERRVQKKQIRLPPPVRLAQYQTPELRSIPSSQLGQPDQLDQFDQLKQFKQFNDTDEGSMESSGAINRNNQQASHPMLGPDAMAGFSPGSPAHVVIRSPAMQAKTAKTNPTGMHSSSLSSGLSSGVESTVGGHHAVGAGSLFIGGEDQHLPPPPLHGQHSKLAKKKWLHGPMQPRQATIPSGRERATWKQPYSYGYFGSKSTRHWGTHHGYRDRHTEYRYR